MATDAPLIPTQLKRLAKRVSLGLGRNGSYSGDGSGDIFIAFSTANPGAAASKGLPHLTMLPNDQIDPLFLATVQATEEAVINAMIAAETMTGINNRTVVALPHDRLREVLKKYKQAGKVVSVSVARGAPARETHALTVPAAREKWRGSADKLHCVLLPNFTFDSSSFASASR